jgi:metal-dependent HD superfamily phosphatase/phosphodiesterase
VPSASGESSKSLRWEVEEKSPAGIFSAEDVVGKKVKKSKPE